MLEVPCFASAYVSQLSISVFANDAPMIWNDLPDDGHADTFLFLIQKDTLKTFLFVKA